MEFIEATAFTKYVYTYLTEDEYLGLQSFLFQYPRLGRLFQVRAVSENFVGPWVKKVKAAA